MELENIQGELNKKSLPETVGYLLRERATGVLEIQDAVGVNRLFILNGIPQGAKLSRLKNPIGKILLDHLMINTLQLDEALSIHSKTEKLLGQILVEKGAISQEQMTYALELQSQENCYAFFSCKEGNIEYHDGLVHLIGFIPAPIQPLLILYNGLKDHAPDEWMFPFLSTITFAAIAIQDETQSLYSMVGPAEQMCMRLMEAYRFTGDLARSVPLPAKALGTFLYSLHLLGYLRIESAIRVPRIQSNPITP